jgi:hypothetical protein
VLQDLIQNAVGPDDGARQRERGFHEFEHGHDFVIPAREPR